MNEHSDFANVLMTREQCKAVLGWKSYAGFSDEQLRAAVKNRETRERAMQDNDAREIA